jgi:hypothetical protein
MTQDSARRGVTSFALILVVLAWGAAVVYGSVWIWTYKTTPGTASGPPATWPESAGLPRTGTTLVVALHPLCTCSQATISELARLMASVERRPAVYALFYDYHSGKKRVRDSSLWQRAAAIPGVTALADAGGRTASRFGAATSGDVIAYSASGRLLFHGGLTAARGHEGDSFGRQRLLALLRDETPDRNDSPVFGCNLDDLAKQSL